MSIQAITYTLTHTQLKAVTVFKLEITAVLKLSQVAVLLDGGSLKKITAYEDVFFYIASWFV